MMAKWKQIVAVYLLLPAVLLASTGLSLRSIYCLCKGERITSLLDFPDRDCRKQRHADAQESHAHEAPLKSCCKLSQVCERTASTQAQGFSAECCTQEQLVYMKLAVQSAIDGQWSAADTAPIALDALPVLPAFFSSSLLASHSERLYALPPRPGGRQWLALGQVMRC
jgi:hypothetical protein